MSPHHRRFRLRWVNRVLSPLEVFTLGVGAFGLPAAADPYGVPDKDTGWLPDSNVHTFCYTASFGVTLRDNGSSAMGMMNGTTDLTTLEVACNSSTDMVFSNVNLSGARRGSNSCLETDPANPNICKSNWLRIDNGQIVSDVDGTHPYEVNLDKTIRHEAGHSVGVTHYKDGDGDFPSAPAGQSDCMISGEVTNSPTWINYPTHHKDHINGYV